jgi:serine/threonine-protein kinase
LHASGRTAEARSALASAVLSHDWRPDRVRDQNDWIFHSLRREAENRLLPNVSTFFDSGLLPDDNDTRIALLGICQFEHRWSAAARIYAAAMSADERLADKLVAEGVQRMTAQDVDPIRVYCAASRYGAGRSAALAGCGRAADGAQLTDAEKVELRRQAREWLNAELDVWSRLLTSGTSSERDMAKQVLSNWQTDPDLSCIRDMDALSQFAPAEAAEYLAFWQKVQAAVK